MLKAVTARSSPVPCWVLGIRTVGPPLRCPGLYHPRVKMSSVFINSVFLGFQQVVIVVVGCVWSLSLFGYTQTGGAPFGGVLWPSIPTKRDLATQDQDSCCPFGQLVQGNPVPRWTGNKPPVHLWPASSSPNFVTDSLRLATLFLLNRPSGTKHRIHCCLFTRQHGWNSSAGVRKVAWTLCRVQLSAVPSHHTDTLCMQQTCFQTPLVVVFFGGVKQATNKKSLLMKF